MSQIKRETSAQSIYVDAEGIIYVVDNAAKAENVFFADGSTFQSKLDAGELTGPVGATGAKGAKGDKGDKGDPGQDGQMGIQGLPGVDGKDGMACRPARVVIGVSTAGWTEADCDYLCDGGGDELEIRTAINALPATGGEVILLDGTYNLANPVDLDKPYVTIRGNGPATKLVMGPIVDEAGAPMGGKIMLSASGCRLLDMRIDYNTGHHCVTVSAPGCVIRDVWFCGASSEDDANYALVVTTSGDHTRVSGCIYADCYRGIKVGGDCCVVTNNIGWGSCTIELTGNQIVCMGNALEFASSISSTGQKCVVTNNALN